MLVRRLSHASRRRRPIPEEPPLPVFAHLSDLHATDPSWQTLSEGSFKRGLGRLSWSLNRRAEHRSEVLIALVDDLQETRPDQVLITGDVTNQGLPSELEDARRLLERLGGPERVFLVPGNHDMYVESSVEAVRRVWAPYLAPSAEAAWELPVRLAGDTAVVGLCSAVPTSAGYSSGRLGAPLLRTLDRLLGELDDRGLTRVVMLHHPPWTEGIAARKALEDATEFGAVLRARGAELVLHGHAHRLVFTNLEGRAGREIPVIGVPSSSALGQRGTERRARYHLLRPIGGGGFELRSRVLDPGSCRFVEGESRELVRPVGRVPEAIASPSAAG